MPSLCDALLKRPSARRAAVLRARPPGLRSESYLLYDSHTSIDTIHGNSRLVTTSIELSMYRYQTRQAVPAREPTPGALR